MKAQNRYDQHESLYPFPLSKGTTPRIASWWRSSQKPLKALIFREEMRGKNKSLTQPLIVRSSQGRREEQWNWYGSSGHDSFHYSLQLKSVFKTAWPGLLCFHLLTLTLFCRWPYTLIFFILITTCFHRYHSLIILTRYANTVLHLPSILHLESHYFTISLWHFLFLAQMWKLSCNMGKWLL